MRGKSYHVKDTRIAFVELSGFLHRHDRIKIPSEQIGFLHLEERLALLFHLHVASLDLGKIRYNTLYVGFRVILGEFRFIGNMPVYNCGKRFTPFVIRHNRAGFFVGLYAACPQESLYEFRAYITWFYAFRGFYKCSFGNNDFLFFWNGFRFYLFFRFFSGCSFNRCFLWNSA